MQCVFVSIHPKSKSHRVYVDVAEISCRFLFFGQHVGLHGGQRPNPTHTFIINFLSPPLTTDPNNIKHLFSMFFMWVDLESDSKTRECPLIYYILLCSKSLCPEQNDQSSVLHESKFAEKGEKDFIRKTSSSANLLPKTILLLKRNESWTSNNENNDKGIHYTTRRKIETCY